MVASVASSSYVPEMVLSFSTFSPAFLAKRSRIGSGRTIYNGFLFDELNNGVPLIENEVSFLLGTSQVPEPGTLVLLCTGLAGIGLAAWRRRK